jgi:phage-related protein
MWCPETARQAAGWPALSGLGQQSARAQNRAGGLDERPRLPQLRTKLLDAELWEIKLSRHRVFYVLVQGPIMVLLHAYKKQSQKAPFRELEVARKRMREVLDD